jgi:hypothetical protein
MWRQEVAPEVKKFIKLLYFTPHLSKMWRQEQFGWTALF